MENNWNTLIDTKVMASCVHLGEVEYNYGMQGLWFNGLLKLQSSSVKEPDKKFPRMNMLLTNTKENRFRLFSYCSNQLWIYTVLNQVEWDLRIELGIFTIQKDPVFKNQKLNIK